METSVTLAVEGITDVPVIERILADTGVPSGPVYVANGKANLDRRLPGYNGAARFSRWIVLRDLNSDEPCAPGLVSRLLPAPSRGMRLHIAVHAVEAWLLADVEGLNRFFKIPKALVPPDPERLEKPKTDLVNLSRYSRSRAVREAIVPAPGTTAAVGPGYTTMMAEFALLHWQPRIAAARSDSLARLIRHLDTLRKRKK
jgi:hypothetical protein